MKHDRILEHFPFKGPLYIHAKAPREQLLQNNHKHWSSPKYFNKKIYTYKNIGIPEATIFWHIPKINSVQFDDPYDHIHRMEHTHENTHLIDPQE